MNFAMHEWAIAEFYVFYYQLVHSCNVSMGFVRWCQRVFWYSNSPFSGDTDSDDDDAITHPVLPKKIDNPIIFSNSFKGIEKSTDLHV